MGFGQSLKNIYYFFEDKWYDTLDKVNKFVPVYKVIDPIDNVVPSFIVFLLLLLLMGVLLGYLIQFASPLEVTFTTLDAQTNDIVSNVNLSGTIDGSEFDKQTNSSGKAIVLIEGTKKNIYEILLFSLLGSEETLTAVISAQKQGYTPINNADIVLSSRAANISLSPASSDDDGTNQDGAFLNTTKVKLVDSSTQSIIVDSTASAFVRFRCSNKTINAKTVTDDSDGSLDGIFELNEPKCGFVITGAFSTGYEEENGLSTTLPKTPGPHTISLSLINPINVTEGVGIITVYEAGTTNNATPTKITGAQVTISTLQGIKLKQGTTNLSGVFRFDIAPGTYAISVLSGSGGYRPISVDENKRINITRGATSALTIEMTKLAPGEERIINLVVLDSNGRAPISGVKISPQKKNLSGNFFAYGVCSNNCITDSNGFFKATGYSREDDGNVIVVLQKDGYLLKVIKPALVLLAAAPVEVLLEKPTSANSGIAKVSVKELSSKRPLHNALAYLFMNDTTLGVRGINVSENGVLANLQGEAIFTGLPPNEYFAEAIFDTLAGDSNTQLISAGAQTLFNVLIDVNSSMIEVNLLDSNSLELPLAIESKADVNLYTLTRASDGTYTISDTPIQHMDYNTTSKLFTSNNYPKSSSFYIKIDLNNYLSSFIEILPGTLFNGVNRKNVNMYSLEELGPIEANDGNVKVFFDGLYSSNSDLIAGNRATFLSRDSNYFAKILVAIAGDANYSDLLGSIQVNNSVSFINFSSMTLLHFVPSSGKIYTCRPIETPPENDENFYVQTSPECMAQDGNIGVAAGIKWKPSYGLLPRGIYSFAPKFTAIPNGLDMLEVDYFGKSIYFDANHPGQKLFSQDKGTISLGMDSSIPDDDPTHPKLYFDVSINNSTLNTTQYDYNSDTNTFSKTLPPIQILPDASNSLKVKLIRNSTTSMSGIKLTAFSSANATAKTKGGSILFDSLTGPKTKLLANSISLTSSIRSDDFNTFFFAETPNSSSFIILKAEVGTSTYWLVLDTQSRGKQLLLTTSSVLPEVKDQLFTGELTTITGDIPVGITSVTLTARKDCSPTGVGELLDTNYYPKPLSSSEISANEFTTTINGVLKSNKDCLVVDVISNDPYFDPVQKIIRPTSGGVTDPTLACLEGTFLGTDVLPKNINMSWGQTADLKLSNTCAFQVSIKIDSGVQIENPTDCATLAPSEECTLRVVGKNSGFNASASAPNFTDMLGVFPVYVKAKREGSRKNYSLVDTMRVHLYDATQCFSISRDTFDFLKSPDTNFGITNTCQYTGFEDYYIPTVVSQIAGAQIRETKPKYDFVDFNYSFRASGNSYVTVNTGKNVETTVINEFYAAQLASPTVVGNLVRYPGIKIISGDYGGTSNRLFFKWIDRSNVPDANYGARIDGQIRVKYRDGKPDALVTPTISFNVSTNPQCICDGSLGGDMCYTSAGLECIIANQDPEMYCEGGAECTLEYGLSYITFPDGNVSEISFDVIGNPDSTSLVFRTILFVNYITSVPVVVPSLITATSTFGEGHVRIYPKENTEFVLKSFYKNAPTTESLAKQAYCIKRKANLAWINNSTLFWVNPKFMHYDSTVNYCESSGFVGTNPTLASSSDLLGSTNILSLKNFSDGWMTTDGNQGFWVSGCSTVAGIKQCGVLQKTTTGFSALTTKDANIIEKFAPVCKATVQNFTVTDEECNKMNIVCDSTAKACHFADQIGLDSFIDQKYLLTINPVVDFNVYNVRSGTVSLPSNAVSIWIEGGLLKARFLGEDYVLYNSGTIGNLSLINEGFSGNDFGVINVTDYINRR